jgi:hypothetical protein
VAQRRVRDGDRLPERHGRRAVEHGPEGRRHTGLDDVLPCQAPIGEPNSSASPRLAVVRNGHHSRAGGVHGLPTPPSCGALVGEHPGDPMRGSKAGLQMRQCVATASGTDEQSVAHRPGHGLSPTRGCQRSRKRQTSRAPEELHGVHFHRLSRSSTARSGHPQARTDRRCLRPRHAGRC